MFRKKEQGKSFSNNDEQSESDFIWLNFTFNFLCDIYKCHTSWYKTISDFYSKPEAIISRFQGWLSIAEIKELKPEETPILADALELLYWIIENDEYAQLLDKNPKKVSELEAKSIIEFATLLKNAVHLETKSNRRKKLLLKAKSFIFKN